MDHVIGMGVRGVSRTIGTVSEVVAGRRRSSASKDNTEKSDQSDSDEDVLSREQDLDDMGDDETTSLEYEQEPQLTAEGQTGIGASQDIAHAFISSHQNILTAAQSLRPIPQSVMLPQRRPTHCSRGFVRAYAPVLGECSGIDQATFMDFLLDFDKAAKAWPMFLALNIAANGIGVVPHPPFQAASIAMGVVAKVGEEMQTRYTTNRFLDNVNKALFKPRGLYALIMTYRPDLPDDPILRADITDPQAVALTKALSRDQGNAFTQKLARFRQPSSGTTRHDDQMPEPAALIYPALDQKLLQSDQKAIAAPGTTQTVSSSSTALERTKSPSTAAIIQDYLDRRAQAQFVATNPNSKLASTLPPQEKKFVNRFADPNHPVNSGSVFGLVTGGTWDPIANGRIRRAERKARKKDEEPLTAQEKHDAYMGRKVRGRVTGTPSKNMLGLKKYFTESVLYLVITNLPDEGQDVQEK